MKYRVWTNREGGVEVLELKSDYSVLVFQQLLDGEWRRVNLPWRRNDYNPNWTYEDLKDDAALTEKFPELPFFLMEPA